MEENTNVIDLTNEEEREVLNKVDVMKIFSPLKKVIEKMKTEDKERNVVLWSDIFFSETVKQENLQNTEENLSINEKNVKSSSKKIFQSEEFLNKLQNIEEAKTHGSRKPLQISELNTGELESVDEQREKKASRDRNREVNSKSEVNKNAETRKRPRSAERELHSKRKKYDGIKMEEKMDFIDLTNQDENENSFQNTEESQSLTKKEIINPLKKIFQNENFNELQSIRGTKTDIYELSTDEYEENNKDKTEIETENKNAIISNNNEDEHRNTNTYNNKEERAMEKKIISENNDKERINRIQIIDGQSKVVKKKKRKYRKRKRQRVAEREVQTKIKGGTSSKKDKHTKVKYNERSYEAITVKQLQSCANTSSLTYSSPENQNANHINFKLNGNNANKLNIHNKQETLKLLGESLKESLTDEKRTRNIEGISTKVKQEHLSSNRTSKEESNTIYNIPLLHSPTDGQILTFTPEHLEQILQKIRLNFKIENFLRMIPDPFTYFREEKRNQIRMNERCLALTYLKLRYKRTLFVDIDSVYERYKYNLTLACEDLDTNVLQRRTNQRMTVKKCSCQIPHELTMTFIHEVTFIEHRKSFEVYFKALEYKKSIALTRGIQSGEAKVMSSLQKCESCHSVVLAEDATQCKAGHTFCNFCIQSVMDSRLHGSADPFSCLSRDCEWQFNYEKLKKAVKPVTASCLLHIHHVKMVERVGVKPLEICPNCGFADIPPDNEIIFFCRNPDCLRETCRMCKAPFFTNHQCLKHIK